jgi:hypothetical protein
MDREMALERGVVIVGHIVDDQPGEQLGLDECVHRECTAMPY